MPENVFPAVRNPDGYVAQRILVSVDGSVDYPKGAWLLTRRDSRGHIEVEVCTDEQVADWAPLYDELNAAHTVQAPDVAASDPGILHMAMRYALGRATYAVSEVCDAIKKHAAELAPGTRERMAQEIVDALRYGRGGMDMDIARWADARRVLLGTDTTPATEETR